MNFLSDGFRDPIIRPPYLSTMGAVESLVTAAGDVARLRHVGTFWRDAAGALQMSAFDLTQLPTMRYGVIDGVVGTEEVTVAAGHTLVSGIYGRVTDTSAAVAAKELGDRLLTVAGNTVTWTGAIAGMAIGDIIYCVDDMALSIGDDARHIQLDAASSTFPVAASGLALTGSAYAKIGSVGFRLNDGGVPGYIATLEDGVGTGPELWTTADATSVTNETNSVAAWAMTTASKAVATGSRVLQGSYGALLTSTATTGYGLIALMGLTVGLRYRLRVLYHLSGVPDVCAHYDTWNPVLVRCVNGSQMYDLTYKAPAVQRNISMYAAQVGYGGQIADSIVVSKMSHKRVFTV